MFPRRSVRVALAALVVPVAFGLFGSVAAIARNTKVACGPSPACACKTKVTIVQDGVCRLPEPPFPDRYRVTLTVACPTVPPSLCQQQEFRCGNANAPISVTCGGNTISAQPTGSRTWGSVFGTGNCADVSIQCGG